MDRLGVGEIKAKLLNNPHWHYSRLVFSKPTQVHVPNLHASELARLIEYRANIVGIYYRPQAIRSMINRTHSGTALLLLREKNNAFDQNAIMVHFADIYNARQEANSHIGYIPKEQARIIAPIMDKASITRLGGVLTSPGKWESPTLQIKIDEEDLLGSTPTPTPSTPFEPVDYNKAILRSSMFWDCTAEL